MFLLNRSFGEVGSLLTYKFLESLIYGHICWNKVSNSLVVRKKRRVDVKGFEKRFPKSISNKKSLKIVQKMKFSFLFDKYAQKHNTKYQIEKYIFGY